MPPFDPSEVPGYWMNEQSGRLRPVIHAFLTGLPMGTHDVAVIRVYLRQWMAGPRQGPMIDVLRTQVDEIASREDIRRWLDRALDAGIDPL